MISSREVIEVQVDTAVSGGSAQEVTFSLPRGGFCRPLYIKWSVSSTNQTNQKETAFMGCHVIDHVSIMASGNDPLERIYGPVIMDDIEGRVERQKNNLRKAALSTLATGATTAAKTFYSPLLALACNQSSQLMYDTDFLQPLRLVVQTNALSDISALGTPVHASNPVLYCEYVYMDSDAYSKHRSAQFSEGSALKQLSYSWFAETAENFGAATANASNTSSNQKLNFKGVADKMLVMVRNTTQKASGNANSYNRLAPIESIEINASGRRIYKSYDALGDALVMGKRVSDSVTNPNTHILAHGEDDTGANVFEIDWSDQHDKNIMFDHADGVVSWGNLSNPTISVTFAETAGNTDSYEVLVFHRGLQILSTNANNGSISVSMKA
jgi:hypothetical protein